MDRREFLKSAAALTAFGAMAKLAGHDLIETTTTENDHFPQVTRRPYRTTGITLPLLTVLGNAAAGSVILCAAVPGLVAAFTILALKTHDTKGVDLSAVRGDEWD